MKPSAGPGVSPSSDDPALFDLVEELADRLQSEDSADLEAWVAAQGEYANRLRRLLPTVQVMAELGSAAGGPARAAGAAEAVPGALGEFRIVRQVGRGGMGVVYEAEQRSLGRRVALKVLPFAATMDPRHLQRFHNEARAAASLEHPHIVPVYGVGCERGVHYYAMKFIDGQSLAALIDAQRQPSLPPGGDEVSAPSAGRASAGTSPVAALSTQRAPRDAAAFRQIAEWGIQAAEALEHAHGIGIVHRDIKPANLMIDGHGALWVTDFGLARTVADAGLTMTGDVLGTLRYMSPEQALAKHGLVDHRTDVYSLGVTLYELLAGRPAVEGKDREQILNAITRAEPRPLRTLDAAIPQDLETVVRKATAKEPAERYGTARELAEDLRRFLAHQPIRAKAPGIVQRARKWAQRHRPAVAAAALVLGVAVVALAVIAYLLWQKEAETRNALGQVDEQRRAALANEAKAKSVRRQAEADLSESLNVMGDLLRVTDKQEFAGMPKMDRVRQDLGAYILRHYQTYLDEQSPDPDIRHRTARTYLSIGILYGMQGEPDKAREALLKSVALSEALTRDFPAEARYWLQLAHNRDFLADHLAGQGLKSQATEASHKATDAFEAAARWAPDNAVALNNLAYHLEMSDDPTIRDPVRAVVLARRAVELAPDHGGIWDTLGVACYRNGDWSQAATALERCLALPPNRTTIGNNKAATYFYLAMAYARLGQADKARSSYDKAADSMEKNAPLFEGLRRLRAEAAGVLSIKREAAGPEKPGPPSNK
jgi:serine/threonine protein kinase/Flp pilus assembly protein TadD